MLLQFSILILLDDEPESEKLFIFWGSICIEKAMCFKVAQY